MASAERKSGSALLAIFAAAAAFFATAAPRAEAQSIRVREVTVVEVAGVVDEEAARAFERSLDAAVRARPAFVIIEVDAEGTEMAPARAMADALGRAKGGFETIAFVRGRVAGTALLVALAADDIALSPGGRLGDGVERDVPGLADAAASLARARDRSPALAAALVDGRKGLTRITIEDPTGASVDRYVLGVGAAAGEGLRVLDRETVLEPGAPLSIEGVRARRVGLAKYFARDRDELRAELEGVLRTPLQVREVDGRNPLTAFLKWAHGNGLLPYFLFLGLLGILVEIWHPSLIFPGVFGLLCVAIALSGGHMAGLTDTLDIALIGTGIALCLIEMFAIPGFGVVGVAGLLCVGAGTFLSMQTSSWPRTPEQVAEWRAGFNTFVLGTIGVMGGFSLISRLLPRSPLLSGLMHTGSQQAADGYTVANASRVALMGRAGTAETDLRPSGKVVVDGESLDAQSEGGWIDRGAPVVVIESHEGRIIVAKKAP